MPERPETKVEARTTSVRRHAPSAGQSDTWSGFAAGRTKGGDTVEALGVVHAGLLEDLGADGDGRVDRVGNDGQVGLGAVLGASGGEIPDDGGVGLR